MSGLNHPTTVPRTNHPADDVARDEMSPIDFEELIQTALDEDNDEDSHTEFDPKVFHPSSVGYTEWLLLVKKLSLEDMSDLLGTFKTGDLIHQYIQRHLYSAEGDLHIETEMQVEEDGLVFTGHADIYDPEANIVYDIKSKGGWYHHNPPVDRHIDQLHCYMRGLDADYGQVIYVSKKDLEVRPWPQDTPFEFDDDRWERIKDRCANVRDALYDEGIPQSEDEIPFDPPGEDHDQHFFYDSADLDFSEVNGD